MIFVLDSFQNLKVARFTSVLLNQKNETSISETFSDQPVVELKISINSTASCDVVMITYKSSRMVN